jgi:hypothetical protein
LLDVFQMRPSVVTTAPRCPIRSHMAGTPVSAMQLTVAAHNDGVEHNSVGIGEADDYPIDRCPVTNASLLPSDFKDGCGGRSTPQSG